jgi:hypothetical protein
MVNLRIMRLCPFPELLKLWELRSLELQAKLVEQSGI